MRKPRGGWTRDQQTEFWREVREHMAELGLAQQAIALVLNVDRANVSRRLAGRMRARPSEDEITKLSGALRLGADGRRRLLSLAGYVREEPGRVGDAGDGSAWLPAAWEGWSAESQASTPAPASFGQAGPSEDLTPAAAWLRYIGDETPAAFLFNALSAYVADLLSDPDVYPDPAAANVPDDVVDLLYRHALRSLGALGGSA